MQLSIKHNVLACLTKIVILIKERILMHSARSCIARWRNYRRIWTNGWFITIMTELIRGKCAVAERHWKHYWMGNRFGLRRI